MNNTFPHIRTKNFSHTHFPPSPPKNTHTIPHVSQLHFEASVRMKLVLPKVGTWSPPGLPKLQSLISRVKTPCHEVFFISLESYQSVDVENCLA
jgi:hypothetical protein